MKKSILSFDFVLKEISSLIAKTPTPSNFQPNPTEPDRQLGLTLLYRFARGCDFQVIDDEFGAKTFNNVIRIIIITYLKAF